jgi:hypothetical protein
MSTITTTNFNFKGNYGKDLLNEVANYALVASTIAKKNKFDIISNFIFDTPLKFLCKQ